ncbi:tripartite tricarboxylate transporter substrate binding protein [Xylophilus sp. GOD-11R]|uniref:Bug family tripartite tricarboxylate transporter substrate binding protein n=1 Tax=Xylophilus sp. GOD-11R TaxID=3089814 RepID=UPI00298D141C|nr:tripartite tricarboxylate transporter substrate binding protein [Xylophilus sp. GOD-11R]WPB59340.1 tripartite tricarboxylate transporter substrate binding protein [Xylophilus sp. GOD-11R]
MKRQTLRMLAATALAATGLPSRAQPRGAYPAQPIRWVVPYAPDGTTDQIARALAGHMARNLGQAVMVDNRPGAASIVGATYVARSPADGYTIGSADSGTLAFNPVMYSTLSYDASKDFSFIGGLGRMPLVLVVAPNFPARSVREYLALVRRTPGVVTAGSSGPGAPLHIALELFKQQSRTDIRHVAYKGSAPALADVAGGQLDSMFIDLPPSLAAIRAGKVRVLAAATPQRLSLLPDVPTMAEAGVPAFEAYAWQGLVGPARLPEGVVQRLSQNLVAALRTSEIRARLEERGIEPMTSSPAEFAAFVRSEQKRWAGVIRAADIRLES